jgi:hypothetical protein
MCLIVAPVRLLSTWSEDIDTAAARRMPGVLFVATGEDVRDRSRSRLITKERAAMPQPSERVNSFLDRAEACRVAAEHANDPEARATYLDLATSWQTLAEQVERLEAASQSRTA